jgi:hypothetical protein
MQSLHEEIDETEQDLLNKIYPGPKGGPKKLFNAAVDDDDVDDRTGDSRRPNSSEVETEDSLVTKWKQYFDEYGTHKLSVARAESRLRALEERLTHAGDEEERFYVQNDLDLAQDVYQKSRQRLDAILSDVNATERLLRIVNRKIIADFETGYIGLDAMPSPGVSFDMPPPSFSMPPPRTLSKALPSPSLAMPPPPKMKKALPSPSIAIDTAPVPADHMLPSEKRLSLSPSEASGDPNVSHGKEAHANEPGSKRPRVVGPVMPPPARKAPTQTGTLAYLAASSTAGGRSVIAEGNKEKSADAWLESKKDEWRAPAGQDGSGKTKLNDKFAGRY